MLLPGLLYHGLYTPALPVERAPYQWVLHAGLAVCLGPLLETLIFQHGLIRWIRPRMPWVADRWQWGSAVLVSAFLFGLAHATTTLRFGMSAIAGLILGGTYWLFSVRQDCHPALAVFAIHAFNNLTSMLHEYGSVPP